MFAIACGENSDAIDISAELTIVAPISIQSQGIGSEELWRLFDRSTVSSWAPEPGAGTRSLRVRFPQPTQLAAIKLYSAELPGLELIDVSGKSIGILAIESEQSVPRWHKLVLKRPTELSSLTIRFDSSLLAAEVKELEFWSFSDDQTAPANSAEALTAAFAESKSSRFEVRPAEDARLQLNVPDPGSRESCISTTVKLSRPFALYARAYLVYRASGLFRDFGIIRSINGTGHYGGFALEGENDPESFSQEIDTSLLQTGVNELRFCQPPEATRSVAMRDIRLVLVPESGGNWIDNVQIAGDQGHDAAKLHDDNPATDLFIDADAAVQIDFGRLVAPDVLRIAGDDLPKGSTISCIDAQSGLTKLSISARQSEEHEHVLLLDGGAASCRGLRLEFAAAATIAELGLQGSGSKNAVDWPSAVITSRHEHFGTRAWVGGFVRRPAGMTGSFEVEIDQFAVPLVGSNFGKALTRDSDADDSWNVDFEASYPNGADESRVIPLAGKFGRPNAESVDKAEARRQQEEDKRYGSPGTSVKERVDAKTNAAIRLGTHVSVDIPAGAMQGIGDITLRHLVAEELPPLDPGLINVTAPYARGYEFLPHGQRFQKQVDVILPYEPALVPEGMSPTDVFAYFYDTYAERWVKLDRKHVDAREHTTHNLTDHFTIMINAVLTVPENPGPLSYDPTALGSLAAANPSSEVDLIAPPTASSTGEASISVPIRIPAGRGNYSPSLGLQYSSGGGNGWLGVGWDLPVSSIRIDTRYGVPQYFVDGAPNYGIEPRYLLDGASLIPSPESDGPGCAIGSGTRYRSRVETSFAYIIRCGTDPTNYHFEVRDRAGTLYTYGDHGSPGGGQHANSSLTDPEQGGIASWSLRQVKDVHGNISDYGYQIDAGSAGQAWTQQYLSFIEYTKHGQAAAPYHVDFKLDAGTRPDVSVSGRSGFKTLTRKLLRDIVVSSEGQTIRQYTLNYQAGQFDKTVLSSVTVFGLGGCSSRPNPFQDSGCDGPSKFYEHEFEYHEEDAEFEDPVTWQIVGDPNPGNAALSLWDSFSETVSGSVGISLPGIFSLGGNGSTSDGERDQVIGFYDIDGDGLPDQLYVDGDGAVKSLENQSGPGRDPTQGPLWSAAPVAIDGLVGLGRELTHGWGASASGSLFFGLIEGSAGYSRSTSRASRILQDLDGDGRLDVATKGAAQLTRPCVAGESSAPLCQDPHDFNASLAIDSRLDPELAELAELRNGSLSPADPVIEWTAPYEGQISLSATAQKNELGGEDGVHVGLYHGNTFGTHLIVRQDIGPEDVDVHTLSTGTGSLSVDAGDVVYLVLGTVSDSGIDNDTLVDRVTANLHIEYEYANSQATGFIEIEDPTLAKDASGAAIFAFDSGEDFRATGLAHPIFVPADGTIEVDGVLSLGGSPASMVACLQSYDYRENASQTHRSFDVGCGESSLGVATLMGPFEFSPGEVTDFALLGSIAAKEGSFLVLRVESDLAVDPSGLTFGRRDAETPVLAYSEVCLTPPGLPQECRTDSSALRQAPLASENLGPFVPLLAQSDQIDGVFVAMASDEYVVTLPPRPDGPYLLALRTDKRGLLWQEDCLRTSCTPEAPPDIRLEGGESLTIELVTNTALTFSTQAKLVGSTQSSFVPLTIHPWNRLDSGSSLFSGGYRGFRYGFWNEGQQFRPGEIRDLLEQSEELTHAEIERVGHVIIKPLPYYKGAEFTENQPAWIAPGSVAYIRAGEMHAARLGTAQTNADGSFGDIGSGIYGNQYLRISKTGTVSASVGVKVPVPGLGSGLSMSASNSTTRTTTDLIDMNGDGIADAVTTRGAFAGTIDGSAIPAQLSHQMGDALRTSEGVTYSLGGKISTPFTTSSGRTIGTQSQEEISNDLYLGADLTVGRSRQTTALMDVNGDGLVDRVTRDDDTVMVEMGLGNRFGAKEAFGDALLPKIADDFHAVEEDLGLNSTKNMLGHQTTITKSVKAGVGNEYFSIGGDINFSSTRSTFEIADLNGDGLPDLLFKRDESPDIQVQFNLGAGFSGPVVWKTPSWPDGPASADFWGDIEGEIEDFTKDLGLTGPDVLTATGRGNGDHGVGSHISGQIPVPIGPLVLSFGGGVSRSAQTDSYNLALVDIDGDGAADHVFRRDGQSVQVKHNKISGKVNLLKRVHGPLGGEFSLDYERSPNTALMPQSRMLLAKVIVSDGVNLSGDFASPDLLASYSYEDGYYDRGEKEFFGFAKVTMTRANGTTTETEYHNDDYTLRGLAKAERFLDQNHHVRTETARDWRVATVIGENGALVATTECLATRHPLLTPGSCVPSQPRVATETASRSEGLATKTSETADQSFDRFGNVLLTTSSGDADIAGDETHAIATYRNDTSRWILGLPTRLEVRAGSASGTLLRVRTGSYNNRGQLTEMGTETGSGLATTRLTYNVFGNLSAVETPPNANGQTQTLSMLYDPVIHNLPIRVTDAFGNASTSTYDIARQVVTSSTDVNGQGMRRTYDRFGRLVTVAGPYGSGPDIEMSYRLEGPNTPWAKTVNQPQTPGDYQGPALPAITTMTRTDGLGRALTVSKTSMVDGLLSTTVQPPPSYDNLGRTVATYQPFSVVGDRDEWIPLEANYPTSVVYDDLDRVVKTTLPDGAVSRVDYSVIPAATGQRLFMTQATDENGHKRESYTDMANRVRAFVEYPSAGQASINAYDYNPLGELTSITDAEGNLTTMNYDLRGLQTQISNADTGLIERRYDLMGNLAELTEPNHRALGSSVKYQYERSRLVKIDYPSKTDVRFIYGAPGAANNGAGRIVEMHDETGSITSEYGALGEVRRSVRVVDSPLAGKKALRFTTATTFDSMGRLLETTYPDGERVQHEYDAGGALLAITGHGSDWSRSYLSELRYDLFGNRTHARFGNDVESSWSYEPQRVRLKSAQTRLPGGEPVQDLGYQYDPASNPIAITSNLPAPGPGSELPGGGALSYQYDGTDRLVKAIGNTLLAPGKNSAYTQHFAYSPSHNLTSKIRHHSVTQPSGGAQSVAPPKTNINLQYAYGSRPHLPTQVGELLMTYDPSGNPLTRRTAGTGRTERMRWDDDGRLAEITGAGVNQKNAYDASGLRVVRNGRSGTTVFASQLFELRNGQQATKHIFAGSVRVASVMTKFDTGGTPGQGGTPPGQGGTPPGQGSGDTGGTDPPLADTPGTAFYFHQDHLSSTAVLTDEYGEVQEHTGYFPDGATWYEKGARRPINGYLFSGKPLDPDSGLYDFGQRFYDPDTSLWLGLDPAFTDRTSDAIGKPLMLASLAYAAQSPIRFIDPDGRDVIIAYGQNEARYNMSTERLEMKAHFRAAVAWRLKRELVSPTDPTQPSLRAERVIVVPFAQLDKTVARIKAQGRSVSTLVGLSHGTPGGMKVNSPNFKETTPLDEMAERAGIANGGALVTFACVTCLRIDDWEEFESKNLQLAGIIDFFLPQRNGTVKHGDHPLTGDKRSGQIPPSELRMSGGTKDSKGRTARDIIIDSERRVEPSSVVER